MIAFPQKKQLCFLFYQQPITKKKIVQLPTINAVWAQHTWENWDEARSTTHTHGDNEASLTHSAIIITLSHDYNKEKVQDFRAFTAPQVSLSHSHREHRQQTDIALINNVTFFWSRILQQGQTKSL